MPHHTEDYFPLRTEATFVKALLKDGTSGRQRINEYVIQDFSQGLKAYFLKSSWRTTFEDFDDLLNEFFLRYLSKQDFYDRWANHGARLRFWLIKTFKLFLFEQYRKLKNDTHGYHQTVEDLAVCDETPEAIMHREFACAVATRACRDTAILCQERGLAEHWQVLLQSHFEGRSFRDLGRHLGVSEDRARMMARTAREKYRQVVRRILLEHGTKPDALDDEINALLEDLE